MANDKDCVNKTLNGLATLSTDGLAAVLKMVRLIPEYNQRILALRDTIGQLELVSYFELCSSHEQEPLAVLDWLLAALRTPASRRCAESLLGSARREAELRAKICVLEQELASYRAPASGG